MNLKIEVPLTTEAGDAMNTASGRRSRLVKDRFLLQKREARGLQNKLRSSFAETTGERRGVAPGSFVDLLVNATDKATGESLSDLERTNQAFVMVMSGNQGSTCVLSMPDAMTHSMLLPLYACSCLIPLPIAGRPRRRANSALCMTGEEGVALRDTLAVGSGHAALRRHEQCRGSAVKRDSC